MQLLLPLVANLTLFAVLSSVNLLTPMHYLSACSSKRAVAVPFSCWTADS